MIYYLITSILAVDQLSYYMSIFVYSFIMFPYFMFLINCSLLMHYDCCSISCLWGFMNRFVCMNETDKRDCLWKHKGYGRLLGSSFGITAHVEFVLVRWSLNIETYTTKIVQ